MTSALTATKTVVTAMLIAMVTAAIGVTRTADTATMRATGVTTAIGASGAIMVGMIAAIGIRAIVDMAKRMAGANIATATTATDTESGAFTGNTQ
jgi:hypothetical protein